MTEILERTCRLCGAVVAARSIFCPRCGAAAEKDSAADDALAAEVRALFGGEFAVDREVGRGAMAVVYSGFDPALERRVAIKVLPPDIGEDPTMAERFRREAQMVAALNHPNVISIYTLRTSPSLSAIVMQFVEGRSLDVALRDRPRLPVPIIGLILSQVAAGLSHAHTRGVVHRDVKPANVLLDPSGHVVVSDFGIARRYGGVSATGSGIILGTASYMSPEQCLGHRAEAASDQYSFGVMAFELFAGRRPFTGPVGALLRAHINDKPPSLAELRPDLPDAVVTFVMRALEKDPAARHATLRDAERFFRDLVPNEASATTELVQAARPSLANVAPDESIRWARTSRVDTEEEPLPLPEPIAVVADQPRRSRSGALAATLVMALAIGTSVFFLRPGRVAKEPLPRMPVAVPAEPTPILQHDSVPRRQPASASSDKQTANKNPSTALTGQSSSPVTASSTDVEPKTPRDSAVRADSAVARPQGETATQPATAAASPAAPITPPPTAPVHTASATRADAQAVTREFVTWCNQRRWTDVDRLAALDGSADLRKEFINLVRNAPDFQAGLDRVASSPMLAGDSFTTEFAIDLEWRGGHRVARIVLRAAISNGAWHLAAFGIQPVE